MELRKLYGDLSDREKQIANAHFLYLTQLDYIDFSSKFLLSVSSTNISNVLFCTDTIPYMININPSANITTILAKSINSI